MKTHQFGRIGWELVRFASSANASCFFVVTKESPAASCGWMTRKGCGFDRKQVLILQSRGYHVPPKTYMFRGFLWKINEHNLFFRWPPKLLGETVQKPRKASVCPWSHHSNPRRWLMRNIWRPNRENLP